ncbi:Abi family protein [Bacteroides uniformis]|uniref:Abi family protein n=1 Tax=Bacteroides uniformis TaxID=820 RepID=UPI001D082E42|nr:Abi family protein [Bacteroides uniformis]MCB6980510.1 Abi family protein [Bacteroides uniformis]MCB7028319.1 Abi family protein [Bacteroides uniformis]
MSNQKPRTPDEHIKILHDRGMEFQDTARAKSYLERVSYFRLKYYWIDMIDPDTDDFIDGASFDTVIERYEFDRELRHILFKAIEELEIGLRTKIITTCSLAQDSGLWYLDSTLFENKDYHEDFVLDLKYEFARSTEPFAREFIRNHDNWDEDSMGGDNPDAWMILEAATFGTLSKMYKNLKAQSPLQSSIANAFGLYSTRDFSSWLEAICVLRNVIAHHSRLWYRIFAKKPVNVKTLRDIWLSEDMTENQRKRAFGVISCLLYLCNAINSTNTMKADIQTLFNSHPNIPIHMLGFSRNWKNSPIWK